MKENIQLEPAAIFAEYQNGCDFKSSIGDNGIYEQSVINERFFIGDQWYGAKCGNTRPLVRRNVIKRIGEFKMSTLTSSPISVNYSADGIPDTTDPEEKENILSEQIMAQNFAPEADDAEISAIMKALSDYFNVTAERVKFDQKKEEAVRAAYISGTGLIYTYWDDSIRTGLYADPEREIPIRGDINIEVLNIDHVNFGDPNDPEIQSQPYILIAQRKTVEAVRREARANGIAEEEVERIIPDRGDELYTAGETGANAEPTDSRRVTVLTKLYKEYGKNGEAEVKAVKVTKSAYVKKPFPLKIKRYPIARFCWERRRNSAYGDSEVTYLIPNQIAINRSLTSEVWALIAAGMPITVVNGDIVTTPVTNDPGQVITVYSGLDFELTNAITHINPPSFGAQYQTAISDLAASTLSDAGANDAALGDIRPDNAAAIVQIREAAMAPMQSYMNRFYDFCEDIARIWADFWLNLYGDRKLKMRDKTGVRYLPFQAERYRRLVVNAKIDVGAATVWSESVVIATLNNLLGNGLITFEQYLERLPAGMIPDVTGLQNDLNAARQAQPQGDIRDDEILQSLQANNPEMYELYSRLSPEQQAGLLERLRAGGSAQAQANSAPEIPVEMEGV